MLIALCIDHLSFFESLFLMIYFSNDHFPLSFGCLISMWDLLEIWVQDTDDLPLSIYLYILFLNIKSGVSLINQSSWQYSLTSMSVYFPLGTGLRGSLSEWNGASFTPTQFIYVHTMCTSPHPRFLSSQGFLDHWTIWNPFDEQHILL